MFPRNESRDCLFCKLIKLKGLKNLQITCLLHTENFTLYRQYKKHFIVHDFSLYLIMMCSLNWHQTYNGVFLTICDNGNAKINPLIFCPHMRQKKLTHVHHMVFHFFFLKYNVTELGDVLRRICKDLIEFNCKLTLFIPFPIFRGNVYWPPGGADGIDAISLPRSFWNY